MCLGLEQFCIFLPHGEHGISLMELFSKEMPNLFSDLWTQVVKIIPSFLVISASIRAIYVKQMGHMRVSPREWEQKWLLSIEGNVLSLKDWISEVKTTTCLCYQGNHSLLENNLDLTSI